MSKKAEIKAILRDGSGDRQFSLHCSDYETVTAEIEKLFEVEGKVTYVVQWLDGRTWIDNFNKGENTIGQAEAVMKKQKEKFPTTRHHIIKRTSTDQIIDRSKLCQKDYL